MTTVESGLAVVGKALAHPARFQVLRALEGGERCGCELVPLLGLDPSVVSRHLAILSRAGLVASRREGVRILWRLASPDIPRILDCLANLTCERTPR